MNKEIIEELMDKYAQGILSTEEQKQLDRMVKDSPELSKELVIRKDIVKSIQYLDRKDLVSMIDKIHSEEIGNSRNKGISKKMLLLLAAGAFSILILVGVIFINNTSQQPSMIYASYYEAYVPITNSRGDNSTNAKDAFTLEYLKKEYKSALAIILPEINTQDNETVLMAAISAIETNDILLGHSLLEKIIEEKDYYYTDHARWYQAMAFLKESKIKEAKSELKILSSDTSSDHYKEATDLLSEL